MSLIQEALRRQQEDSGETPPAPSGKTATPTPSLRPGGLPVPPPLPQQAPEVQAPEPAKAAETPPPELEPKKKSNVMAILGILLLVVVLLGGGVWMMLFAFKQWKTVQPPDQASTPEPIPAVVAAAPQEPPVAPEPTPAVTPAAPRETASAQPAAKPAAVAAQPAAVVPKPEPAAVDWPSLSVSAIVGRGTTGAAIINGKVIGVMETIDGAEVIGVGQQGVKLGYEGEVRFLKVGSSID